MVYIYKIQNIINGKVYIGFTKNPKVRWKAHQHETQHNRGYVLHQAMRKYGIENFSFEIISSDVPDEDAIQEEQKYIAMYDSYKNGYNMNDGGFGLRYMSEESKEKLSRNNYWRGKPRSGELNPMFGRTHSEEARQKMANARKGKSTRLGIPCSEETKKKIGDANRGRPSKLRGRKRPELAMKMSISRKGKECPNKRKTYIITKPDGTEELIIGLKKYCKENGLSASNLSSVANGKLNHYKGYKARYA